MEAEQALDEVDECFKILSAVVNCSSVPVKSSKFDVIAELTKSLLLNLSQSSLEWAQQLSQSDSSCPPSTSQTPDKVTADDPRIFLGYILGEIYDNLSNALKNNGTTDEEPCISVQNESILNASLQFYILAQVLPFLDEGIGIPIYKRSNYLKSWARIIENIDIRKIQLRNFISVIHKLLDCNESLKEEILQVYLADIICAVEQLSNLGEHLDERVAKMIDDIPKHDIIIVLMSLTKVYEKTKPIPIWFTTAIGRRISGILYSTDGIFHVLGVYAELGGETFWENSHLLSQIARQLALPPRNAKRMAYFEHINQQFLELLLQKQVFPKNGIFQLYSTFMDSMALKEPLAADVLVLDKLLQPFEILFEIGHDQIWDSKMSSSLVLLSFLLEDRFCPQVLFKTDRIFQIIPLFTSFLLSSWFDVENCPAEIKSIMENILKVLKYLAGRVENLGQLLFSFIVENTVNLYEIVSVKRLVSVIGEETDNRITVHRVFSEDEENILMKKLDAVLKLIKELEKPADACVLIEILCESAHSWTNSMEGDEELRFVKGENSSSEVKKRRNASHVAALFCFEQLGEWDVNAENPKVIEALSKLITTILYKSVERIKSDKAAFFDVTASVNEEESKMIAIQKTSTKMAVGLAAAVVAAGTVASTSYLNSVTEALSHYVAQESSITDEELMSAVKDAKDILLLLNAVGIKVETKLEKNKPVTKDTSIDFLVQLRNDLDDEMVPIRGQALIRISRALRSRGGKKEKIVSVLDTWLYEKVKDLLQDPDSYVYLAAINALAEITCLNVNKYLDQLLSIFIQIGQNTTDSADDSMLIMRGKLAETIARIFNVLGDISPVWIGRTANVFFTSLKDKSDIVRASSLSAFADFILSCRGKGIHKVLEELLFAIDSLLKTDDSDLVRRAAVHLLRNLIKSCGAEIFSVLGDYLRDLHRTLRRLWKYDRDHVVRLHAEICLEEISAGLKSSSTNFENITVRPIAI